MFPFLVAKYQLRHCWMYFVSLLNVFCFKDFRSMYRSFCRKKITCLFLFSLFCFSIIVFEKINTPLCEDLYENNSQFRNFIFGTIFGQPHINIDYLWDFLTFMVIFILGGTGHCFSVVEQVFKCWWKKFG